MVDQIYLALLWTTTVWFETKPLDQRGAIPRKNNTGVRKPRGHAYANLIDRQGTAPAAAAVAHKRNLGDQMRAGKTGRAGPRRSRAAAPGRRSTRARRARWARRSASR